MCEGRIGAIVHEADVVRDAVLDELDPLFSSGSYRTWIPRLHGEDHSRLYSCRHIAYIESEILTRVHRPDRTRLTEVATPCSYDIIGRSIDHISLIFDSDIISIGSTGNRKECEHRLLTGSDERCEVRIFIDIDSGIQFDEVLIESILRIILLIRMYPLIIPHNLFCHEFLEEFRRSHIRFS